MSRTQKSQNFHQAAPKKTPASSDVSPADRGAGVTAFGKPSKPTRTPPKRKESKPASSTPLQSPGASTAAALGAELGLNGMQGSHAGTTSQSAAGSSARRARKQAKKAAAAMEKAQHVTRFFDETSDRFETLMKQLGDILQSYRLNNVLMRFALKDIQSSKAD